MGAVFGVMVILLVVVAVLLLRRRLVPDTRLSPAFPRCVTVRHKGRCRLRGGLICESQTLDLQKTHL